MAGLGFSAVIPPTPTGTSKITLVQVKAPTNQRVKVKGFSFSFDGTSNTATPITCGVERQSSQGSTSSLTPKKLDDSMPESIQSTCFQDAGSAQPTAGDLVRQQKVHPQGGWEEIFAKGDEITIPGGERLGFFVTAAAGVNAVVEVICEE